MCQQQSGLARIWDAIFIREFVFPQSCFHGRQWNVSHLAAYFALVDHNVSRMRLRDKSPQTFDGNKATTAVHGNDLDCDWDVLCLELYNPIPAFLVLESSDGETELSVYVLL
mmetsp:Transcript_29369/g.113766  ORF Transcript_29369/g.113766 Transcript_29369/m.113766 type:complete len:112 (-) Transcript_29369:779-1114(-)